MFDLIYDKQFVSIIVGLIIYAVLVFIICKMIMNTTKALVDINRGSIEAYCIDCGSRMRYSVWAIQYDHFTGEPVEFVHQLSCKRCKWKSIYNSMGIRFRTNGMYKPTLEHFRKFGNMHIDNNYGKLVSNEELKD